MGENNQTFEPVYEVVSPLGRKAADMTEPATRLDTLEGKTICELWNMIFRGDMLFREIEEQLSRRYPGVRFVDFSEFGYTHGGQEEATMASLADNLEKHGCDAVISAVGG